MSSSLGTLYENARVYAMILRDCSLPQVADWKLEDVKRAFNWAQYFHQVHQRIAKKTSIVNKLESKLKEISSSLCVRFGQEELSYDFLIHSSLLYCTRALLDNPALPEKLHGYILSKVECPLLRSDIDFLQDKAVHAEIAIMILGKIHSKLKDDLNEEENEDILHSLKSLDAGYLRQDLSWLQQVAIDRTGNLMGSYQSHTTAVETRLSSLAQTEGGMEVILLALLLHSSGMAWLTTGTSHPDNLDPPRRAILEWLVMTAQAEHKPPSSVGSNQQERSICEILWDSNHYKLLTRVSTSYFSFFKEHLKFLVSKTEKLDSILSTENMFLKKNHGGDEISPDNHQQMKWVVSQWVELVQGGSHLRDVCLPVLKSRVFPHLVSDEMLLEPKGGLYNELSHTGCLLEYSSVKQGVWNETLKTVMLSIKDT